MDVSEPASISTGIAARYATAIFELAKEGSALTALEADLDTLETALNDSADLRAVLSSPVYSREDLGKAITALSDKLGLSATTKGALGMMAQNRRLFALPQLIAELRRMIADEKGEITAEVTSATVLTKAQADQLAATLKANVGKTVKLNVAVDENLIGGLIVKVGSKMIDTSIRSKLAALQHSMKEVG
ncbi:F0F1 ATP synthase subunit delta [Pararhodobacter aggregans]|uniref:ATP synthase subunit delta n=1 Tax=Pararhodobacter aggregans TaxID=404875 RepID=A0A2T7UYL3_9RHOB|nr:F0F1 ATP synthase subunit delta [Pararhodobacter aggregans]PVE49606.1 F0F1 ATP synthase subunit delta [Pararhodobacter aggregans]